LCDSHREEVASLLTHAVGVVFSVAALAVMLVLAADSASKLATAAVFGVSLVLLYSSSTLYHFSTSPLWKARMQTLDHACIYLLIAGTYTPFTLVSLRGPLGWMLFFIVWAMAVAGVMIKVWGNGRKDHGWSTALYLVMGWLALVAIVPLAGALQLPGIAWLVGGGLSYTLGVVFFAWRRLPFNHAIWHLFVLGGSICHVLAVCFFVF
jgi:hemolysin III